MQVNIGQVPMCIAARLRVSRACAAERPSYPRASEVPAAALATSGIRTWLRLKHDSPEAPLD